MVNLDEMEQSKNGKVATGVGYRCTVEEESTRCLIVSIHGILLTDTFFLSYRSRST